jgi:hypothetical protein
MDFCFCVVDLQTYSIASLLFYWYVESEWLSHSTPVALPIIAISCGSLCLGAFEPSQGNRV